MDDADKLIVQGFQLLNEGDYSKALTKFDKAIKADPNNSESYYGKAEAAMLVPKVSSEEIISLYGKAIELDPDNPFYRSSLGAFCIEEGKFNEAEAAYCKAAELDPNNASDYYSEFAVSYYRRAPEVMEQFLDEQGLQVIKRKALKYLLKSIDLDIEEARKILC